MAQTLLSIAADLQLSLAAAVTVGQTTATLSSASDSDGVALPSGKYGFTVDGDTSAKEYIVCDLAGTALTNIQNITRQGVATTGFANYHRFGATVTITDWAILDRMLKNLNGTTGFDAGEPLIYDGQPLLSDPTAIPTVQFVLDTASGGSVSFNATTVAGDAGEVVADGDWVYYTVADGEWYVTDADIAAKSLNVRIGKARGAGTDGNPIVGGVFVAGLETVGTYTPGQTYYLSNTPGALSTSAGTNSVVVGYGDANGNLILNEVTPNQATVLAQITPTALTAPVVRVYNANDTWNKPAGLKCVSVEIQAPGGGAGAARNGGSGDTSLGGGGGGGGYGKKIIAAASLASTETVTIGAFGTGSTDGTTPNGTAGGTTSFGAHLSITGGGVGQSIDSGGSGTGGAGGISTGGDLNVVGQAGGTGGLLGATSGGSGGATVLGYTTFPPISQGSGSAGIGYGSGGAGAVRTGTNGTQTGGNGAPGVAIVTEYYF